MPLIFSEVDEQREGYYINRWVGGLELSTYGGDVIELVDPNKRQRGPGGWGWPEPGTEARWMQVEPVNDMEVQLALKLEHEKKLAEAQLNSQWDEDEEWGDDDGLWGWASPEPEAAPASPSHSPQPSLGPEDAPTSPSYSPQPSPEPEAEPASPSYSPQPTPEPEEVPASPRD